MVAMAAMGVGMVEVVEAVMVVVEMVVAVMGAEDTESERAVAVRAEVRVAAVRVAMEVAEAEANVAEVAPEAWTAAMAVATAARGAMVAARVAAARARWLAQHLTVHEASCWAACAARFARLCGMASWGARCLEAPIAGRANRANEAAELGRACGIDHGPEEVTLCAWRRTRFDEPLSNADAACGARLARRLPGLILIEAGAAERRRGGAGWTVRAPWALEAVVDGGHAHGRAKRASWTHSCVDARFRTVCPEWAWL